VPKLLRQLQTCWSTTLCIRRLEELWSALENLSEIRNKKCYFVALAALAATASFAQSSVTISGLVDIGYRSVNTPASIGGDTQGAFHNGSATTAVILSGTEDLGGGMRALFRYEMNPDFVGGSGLTGQALPATGTVGALTNAVTNNGGNGYNFVGIQTANMGAVRLGRLNTATLGTWGVGSVFGTALGSGWGTNGNMFTVNSSSASNFFNTAPTRFNGAVEYTTATINGFTGRFLFVPKVDNTGAGSENATSGGLPGVNRAGVTDIGLAYNKGPLNIAAAQQKHKFGANAVAAAVVPGASSSAVNGDYTLTTMAANYTMGAATVYAMYWTEKQDTVASTTTKLDAVGTQLGARYISGPWTFMGAYSVRDDKSTANATASSGSTVYADSDRKTIGLGVEYALSKRSALYARYQSVDPNTNRSGLNTTTSGNSTASFDKVTTTAVGVRHTF